jgi:class 3 adenylate cyclase
MGFLRYAWFHWDMNPDAFLTSYRSALEQKVETVLYAVAGESRIWNDRERDSFMAEVETLAIRYNGCVNHSVGAAAVFFDEPGPCLRMAMDLQRNARRLHLRIGIHTAVCDTGTGLAAQVAMTAATGSIAISPATYALVKHDVHADPAGCLVMEEFHDTDLAQVCLTPAPVRGGADLSTFAGLGGL